MRITRMKIDNYGPVRDLHWELAPGMTVFYGPNESGKTLVVESILKLLLDGHTSEIAGIDRVTGNPAGFIMVETDNRAVQLPDADYTDLFPAGTTREDIRNAFVIRDYDLRLPDRQRDFGHTAYFRDVTDRLLGAETQKIESVQEHIADLGHLANKDSTRLMNRSPVKLKDRYEAAQSLVAELESYLELCEKAEVVELVRERRETEAELTRVRKEIQELEAAEQQAKLNTGRSLVERLETIEEHLRALTAREDEITEYQQLRNHIDSYRASTNGELSPRVYLRGIVVASILFISTLVASVLSPLPGLSAVAGAVFLVNLYLGYQYYDTQKRLGERYELVDEANFMGIEEDDLPGIYQEIESRIEEHDTERDRLSQKRSETLGKLQGIFNADHETLDGWKDELESVAETTPSVDRSFDPVKLQQLQDAQTNLRQTLESIRNDLAAHRERLEAFDRELRDIRPGEFLEDIDSIRIQSVADLRDAIDTLHQFITELETVRENALVANEIFTELKEQEEQEINHLFSDDSFIVSTFNDVTDGNYTDVWFDEDSGIRVKRVDDRELSPNELSQGTYDLLYLTIRLQLATNLLDGEPGFLLLDDAFVHSDASRITREVAVLDSLASAGWQILYFSFREPIRDAIAASNTGTIIDLDPLSFSE